MLKVLKLVAAFLAWLVDACCTRYSKGVQKAGARVSKVEADWKRAFDAAGDNYRAACESAANRRRCDIVKAKTSAKSNANKLAEGEDLLAKLRG